MGQTTKPLRQKPKNQPRSQSGNEELVLDSIIPYQINRLSHRMNKLLDQELRLEGLSITYWRVMAVLVFNKSISINDLADYAMIEQSTLSRKLRRMDEKGLIEIKSAKTDGRVRHINLTPYGRKKYNAVRKITLKHVDRIVDGFSKKEQAQIMKYIKQMEKNTMSLDLPE